MDGNLGMAMLFEDVLLEQDGRVQQPPKIRKIIGVPLSKNKVTVTKVVTVTLF